MTLEYHTFFKTQLQELLHRSIEHLWPDICEESKQQEIHVSAAFEALPTRINIIVVRAVDGIHVLVY